MLGPNVKIASEKKMRAEADSLACVDTFPLKRWQTQWNCFTPHLWEKVDTMLNQNDDCVTLCAATNLAPVKSQKMRYGSSLEGERVLTNR